MNIKATSGKMEAIIFKFGPLFLIVMLSFLIINSVAIGVLSDDWDYLLGAFSMAALVFSVIGFLKALELRSLKRLKHSIVFTSLSFSAPGVVLFLTSDILIMFSALFVSAALAFELYVEISLFRRNSKEQKNQDHHQGIGSIN